MGRHRHLLVQGCPGEGRAQLVDDVRPRPERVVVEEQRALLRGPRPHGGRAPRPALRPRSAARTRTAGSSRARGSADPACDGSATSRLASARAREMALLVRTSRPLASSAVKGAAKTDTRRSAAWSSGSSIAQLQSSADRSERCRSSMRLPPVSRSSRSASPASRPATPSTGSRAAASSIARAMPSRPRQMSLMRGRSSCAAGHPAAAARPTNSTFAVLAGQAGHWIDPLVRDQQPGAAGREHPEPRRLRQQLLEQHDDAVDDVLAVVEHQQHVAAGQPGHQRLFRRATALLAEPERLGRRGRDSGRVGDGNEVDVAHQSVVALRPVGGDHLGEPGLADAAGPHGGDEPVLPERLRRVPPARRPGRRRASAPTGSRRRRAVPPARLRGGLHQPPAVGHVELAQQRRHVALDRAYRDEQPLGDLGVGQVVGDSREHLPLACRHRLLHCCILPCGPVRRPQPPR